MTTRPLRIAQLGTGMISRVHIDACRAIPGFRHEFVLCAGRDPMRGQAFAKEYGIPEFAPIDRWAQIVTRPDIDVVVVALPNYLHGPVALAAARAGKHVLIEKPLCLSLDEADELVALSAEKGVVAGYLEELCYIPKFERMKHIADSGGLGKLYMVKQCEKHGGPYSPWFFDRAEAGGGITMDMGCHAIEFCRWFAGKPQARRVTAHMATYLHGAITTLEDHVILDIEWADGTLAHVESSWALKGGMESTAEAYGTEGVVYADLLRGMGLRAYSERGYPAQPGGKSQVGGDDAKGWSFPDYDWLWNNGYPQEFADMFRAIESGGEPRETAKDGRAVLEIMWAAYASAGQRKTIDLPFRPPLGVVPVDLFNGAGTR